MAPAAQKIEQALVKGTKEIYRDEPDTISVNKVRQHVTETLELPDDLLVSERWKAKSKKIIKETMDQLLDGGEPEDEPAAETKKPAKRQSPEGEKPAPKRRRTKKAETASEDEQSEVEDASSAGEKPEDDDAANEKGPGAAADSDSADKKLGSQEEEEEFSDVMDEDPAPKRKPASKASPKDLKRRKEKPAKKGKKETTASDPQQEEIKKLQGQLLKCGVRKVWGNELKRYGTDAKAKIRHLKGMLTDVGMDGRFSEQRAREIKERRELMADVEAANEMNQLWGDSRAGRRTRGSRGRSMKEGSGSGDEGVTNGGRAGDEEMDGGSGDEEEGFAARKRRAQSDLAFLGDDSDSD